MIMSSCTAPLCEFVCIHVCTHSTQDELSLRFELTGGFIKNAILSALSIAVSRDGDNPTVCQKDLLQGANLQLRGRLRMKDFDRRVVPVAGLDEVIVEEPVMRQLRQIVQFEKARYVATAFSFADPI